MQIGWCASETPISFHDSLTNLAGFPKLRQVTQLQMTGNTALTAIELLDSLIANQGPTPLKFVTIQHNPLVSAAQTIAQLDALGVPQADRELCSNLGDSACQFCMAVD